MRRLTVTGAMALALALLGVGIAQAINEPMIIKPNDVFDARPYSLKKPKFKSKFRRKQERGW